MRAPLAASLRTVAALAALAAGLSGTAAGQPTSLVGNRIQWNEPGKPAVHLNDADTATRRWVAEEMARLGYYGGAVDAPDLVRLGEAVRSFRRDSGLPGDEPLLDEAVRQTLAGSSSPDTTDDGRVLAVEELRCEGAAGDWAVVYEGQRVAGTAGQSGLVPVRLDRRLGLRHHPDAPEGVDPSEWWCTPRRRVCYGTVGFADWGGRQMPGAVVDFHPSRVLPAAGAWDRQIAQLIGEQCGRLPAMGSVPR